MIAAPIWNIVAEKGKPQTWYGRGLFHLPEEVQERDQDELASTLEAKGCDPKVARAFLNVAPLYLEREAISRAAKLVPKIRPAVPEVLSLEEAVALGTMEDFLTPPQASLLRKLLMQATQLKP